MKDGELSTFDVVADEFVTRSGLGSAVVWLLRSASHFFGAADFELRLLPREDEEQPTLAVCMITRDEWVASNQRTEDTGAKGAVAGPNPIPENRP